MTNTNTIDVEEIKELAGKENTETKEQSTVMGAFVKKTPDRPKIEEIIEGPVINIDKSAVYVDLRPYGTGIIYGREFINSRDVIKKINLGDTVTAKIVEEENEDGYIELSLKEARQAMVWSEAEAAIKNKEVFEILVKDANKGGLMLDWQGIQGFLPASQLKAEHYPRVEDGDKDKILGELKKLIGERIPVIIITADPKEGKMIFSERDPNQKEREEIVEKYNVGNELEGEITGVVDFGVFVKIEEGLEGLVHISELDWGLVEDPRSMYNVGDKVKVKVIEVKDGKISLSIKALKKNPWSGAEEKYKKGDIVDAVIIKYNQYGALASIEEGVAGLIHVSEFGTIENLKEALELGKSYRFKINVFEPKEQKMTLVVEKEEKEKKED